MTISFIEHTKTTLILQITHHKRKKDCSQAKKLGTEEMNYKVSSLDGNAAETWTLMQADKSRLEVIEIWIWSMIQKISCKDKKTNEEILCMV